MKIVVNKCFGGFSLSAKATRELAKLKGFELFAYGDSRMVKRDSQSEPSIIKLTKEQEEGELCVYWIKQDLGEVTTSEALNKAEWFHERDIKRDDADLVRIVRKLKSKANGRCAKLEIIDIPDDVDYEINDYDGMESIHEKHRSW